MTATLTEDNIRRSSHITVICDVLLIVALVVCLLVYTTRSTDTAYQQNIENITNIATASSSLVQAALDNISEEISIAYAYCNGKSEREILDYLSLVNSSETEYQLLRRDETQSTELFQVYYGYSTRQTDGDYTALVYEDTALAQSLYLYAAEENGVVSYSQSFTNRTDAQRYFAVFCGLAVREADGSETRYFLVKPQKETRLLAQAQTFTQYQDVNVAICYQDGKYLAHEDTYRAENFFDYLYKYNDLSLDERNAIRDSVQQDTDSAGVLTYRDYQRRPCAFAYAACGSADEWLVLVSVPTEEFVTENLLSIFPLIVIGFLLVLLFFNIWRLLSMVSQLRRSANRERVANSSKSSFLSRMSHEIRTPLNAIIGYNTIAQSEMTTARDDTQRRRAEMKVMDCLVKSEVASKHLLTIINDVLDMSAIEGGKIVIARDRFDLKGLITSLTTVFYAQARTKGVRFEVVLDPLTEEWFVGDQMRVNQVLTNLLGNAIKFTGDGGQVTLRIHQPEPEQNAAHLSFRVEDTGIGMTAEYLTHIWTPFEQADSTISRRFGGSGLGLSIAKNLVDLMGGNITVESQVGVGTTFQVDLTFQHTEQPSPQDTYDFRGVSALVVDDDESTCDYIRLLFNRCGAKCATVTSGADAVKAVQVATERGEQYSLFLVDWKMPQMDGLETIRRIREIAGAESPFVVLSAYDYGELQDTAERSGVSQFLSKPLFQSSLFDLLANVCSTPAQEPVRDSSGPDFHGARVLLAEDNAMNMEIAKTIMESAGLVVDDAWNGREAVAAFTASAPGTYMAILMDIHMPEMNGHDATRAIRSSQHPEAKTIPIIAMTADAFAENVAEALAAGMNDHISKPIDIDKLFEILGHYKTRPHTQHIDGGTENK